MKIGMEWLGRRDYAEILQFQERLVPEIRAGLSPEKIFLLEHDPVYTIGRTRNRSSLVDERLLPHPLFTINRGGQATYHGPGQLVVYPLLDLDRRGRDLHRYLRALEEIIILYLEPFGVAGRRRDGLTGVWVEDRKIAAIGVGVRRWVSMHGFALNIDTDLSGFQAVVPCGIDGVKVTSLNIETGQRDGVRDCAEQMAHHLGQHLESLLPVA